ncbi:ATP-binding protein [Haliea sp. E1-2-M8]|uniref:sensor histidine kinase n=1 Tax=Haliea sp. E1-2-M8 TaxID=3064706 RepID=UPI002715C8B5|nr:ATP-binding protein [Haliea sp. E1-2-M8]MDO8860834.1 ATP-binding protein [Haliea sp. E1-2-M8]
MKSIRTSLVVMLVAAFTLVSFVAALNGYRASMDKAEILLDAQLRYASDILTSIGPGYSTEADSVNGAEGFVFQVWDGDSLLLRSASAPTRPLTAFEDGYRYVNFGGYRWRTLTVASGEQRWSMVAERADVRYLLAESVVLESVTPLLLWLPVAALLIWVLVGWGLAPLRDLSRQINRKASDDLAPLQYTEPPAELRQVIESTNGLLLRLAAALQREKHFASHAAHELRTPISALKIHLHNLEGELGPSSALTHANAGVQRMQHLVEQLLDLARTQPELIKANFHTMDLHLLAQRVTADSWPEFEVRGQSLSLTGESVLMQGDEAMLEVLLRNLLDNARKYTPSGGEVAVFAGRRASSVVLEVADSGPGIPRDERERVFERFYRVGERRQGGVTGAGLGLAIVQHIVQLHGARISLGDSALGSGLAVTVEFGAGTSAHE